MYKVSTRTSLGAALGAAISALGTAAVTVWNLAAVQRDPTPLSHLSSGQRLGLASSLGLLSLAAVALVGWGLYQRGTGLARDIEAGRRGELSIYGLALPMAITTFVTNQVFLSNAYLLGVGFGFWQVVPWAYGLSFLAGLGALSLAVLASLRSGRRRPLIWRMATMVAILGVPAWFLGGRAALFPFRSVLLAWFQSVGGSW